MAAKYGDDLQSVGEARTPTTLLRLKRKRSEDPSRALFVYHAAAKKIKSNGNEQDEHVFRLMGTVDGRSPLHCQPMIENLGDLIENTDDLAVTSNQENDRLSKIIKKHSNQLKQGMSNSNSYKIISRQTTVEEEPTERLEREAGKKLIEIIDVGKENIDQDRKEESSHDSDEILCNSMKMMREKLTISEDSEIQDADYVYDLYYASKGQLDSNHELYYIQSLDPDILLSSEIDGPFDQNEIYDDDEDDSNDEDNWRNDYPDEDEFYSSQEEVNKSQCSSDSDRDSSDGAEFTDNRYRLRSGRINFDPYYSEDPDLYNFEIIDDDDGMD
eukprot:Seg3449.4 transcript_id=Seg3449.4/GoldUCD/mRNA.D3Y31 product="putative RNA polymerase II nuclear localization protein SLC7A6OS" protein_id=Seg3449.4/GoldUCD/D3Y31